MPANLVKTAIVWSQPNCQFCTMAKGLLTSKGYTVDERKIGLTEGPKVWTKQDLIEAVPNARSVPQIFVGEDYVGGYQDLVKYLQK